MADANSIIPVGFCQCGCGQQTPLATVTRRDRGHVRGQPLLYMPKHNGRWVNHTLEAKKAAEHGLFWCRSCKTAKDREEFCDELGRHGPRCRDCGTRDGQAWRGRNREQSRLHLRRANLKRNYGMTIEDYQRMFEEQGGTCAICGKPERLTRKDGTVRNLHVDHVHESGKIRGLLCHYCNTAIGAMREDETLLLKAIEYLRQHK